MGTSLIRRGVAVVCVAVLAVVGWALLSPGDQSLAGKPVDAVDASWTKVPDAPLTPRSGAVGAFVGGRFVVVGGSDGPPCPPGASCAFGDVSPRRDGATFDPVSKQWRKIADAPVPVNGSNVAVLDDRVYVLVADQRDWNGVPTFLRYKSIDDSWSALPAPPKADMRLVATPSAVVAISQGDLRRPVPDLVFDDAAGRWRTLPNDPLGRNDSRDAVWTEAGLVLVATEPEENVGSGVSPRTQWATLDPSLQRWTAPHVAARGVYAAGMTAVGDHIVVANLSGVGAGILEPTTNSWSPLPADPSRGEGLNAWGLVVGRQAIANHHLFDPSTGGWTKLPDPPWDGDINDATVIAGPDSIYVWGGVDKNWDMLKHGYLLQIHE